MSKGQHRQSGRSLRGRDSQQRRAASARGPTAPSPWVDILCRARAAAGKWQWQDAVRLYQQVLEQQPDQLEALEALARAELELQQPVRAMAWLERARRGAPRNARLLGLLAKAQRQSGASAEAIETYQKALLLDARQPELWLELARTQVETRALEPAVSSCLKALELDPGSAAAWHVASQAFGAAGKLSEALKAEWQALARNPWLAEAHVGEALLLERSGALPAALVSHYVASLRPETAALGRDRAEQLLEQIEAQGSAEPGPEPALVRELLGAAPPARAALLLARQLCEQKRLPAACLCFERAIALGPDVESCRELAQVLWNLGQKERAQLRLLQALELEPSEVEAYRLLSGWLASELRFVAGEARWQQLLADCPEDVVALVNLGAAAQRMGRPSEAIGLQQRALLLRPDLIEPCINLAAALCDVGEPARAAAAHARALAMEPQRWAVHSNLLLNGHFDPQLNPEALLQKHREFGRALCEWLGPVRYEFSNGLDPERRLRIGYVSPDFVDHPVAYFLEPVLREHDARAFEVYCYSDVARPDAVTTRLAQSAALYRGCAEQTDEALAERIRADQIDILVDLAGHGLGNRLPVFARKPSPVQVTWLGYFDTTGLHRIDYRIADEHSVPSGAERLFVERVVRLPRSSTCFLPRPSPDPAPPPCLARRASSFGCFCNPSKITRDVAAVFGRILRASPGSRLLLKYHTFADPGIQARFVRWFAEESVGRERLQFQGHSAIDLYLAAFAEVDVALDPFPYSGETTALHTLWMGVPLVALEGRTVAERLASRVLRVAGLHDWVARSSDEYVQIAERLASDPRALALTRSNLRQRLQASPLLDHRGVTRDLEAAYRGMWRSWCARVADSQSAAFATP